MQYLHNATLNSVFSFLLGLADCEVALDILINQAVGHDVLHYFETLYNCA